MAEQWRRSQKPSADMRSPAAAEQPKQRLRQQLASIVRTSRIRSTTSPYRATDRCPRIGPPRLVSAGIASVTVTATVTAFSLSSSRTQLELDPKQKPIFMIING